MFSILILQLILFPIVFTNLKSVDVIDDLDTTMISTIVDNEKEKVDTEQFDDSYLIKQSVLKWSNHYNVDSMMIFSIISVESNYRINVVSSKGAIGIMQIIPTTAKYMSDMYNIPYKNKNCLYDYDTNIRIGIAYVSYLSDKFDNDRNKILKAYNAGPSKVKTSRKNYYVKRVDKIQKRIEKNNDIKY